MRIEKFFPTAKLRNYIKYFVISESSEARTYKVLPSTSLVMGFQYDGRLSALTNQSEKILSVAGITGLQDSFRVFKNSPKTGTVLVYFTETGAAKFIKSPLHELFNQSISLENLFIKSQIIEVEEKLSKAKNNKQRIKIVEDFLLSQFIEKEVDKLIAAAVKLIQQAKGNIRIKELNKRLFISQSPLEKRFRSLIGTTPKKFAALVRVNSILKNADKDKSLIEITYENNYFDQAHFIKDFKRFIGETPEKYFQKEE